MKTMAVAWNGTTLNDKVKLLSVTELGFANRYAVTGEGTQYNVLYPVNKLSTYWTRTRSTYQNNTICIINYDGTYIGCISDINSATYTLAPVIRLG